MGLPSINLPPPAVVPPVDLSSEQVRALNYADTENKLRISRGRKGAFELPTSPSWAPPRQVGTGVPPHKDLPDPDRPYRDVPEVPPAEDPRGDGSIFRPLPDSSGPVRPGTPAPPPGVPRPTRPSGTLNDSEALIRARRAQMAQVFKMLRGAR